MKGYDTSNGYMGYVERQIHFYLPVSKSISSLWKIKGGKIMFGFDKMFDFNRDGKLDSWERAAQFQFMDEMMKDDEKVSLMTTMRSILLRMQDWIMMSWNLWIRMKEEKCWKMQDWIRMSLILKLNDTV